MRRVRQAVWSMDCHSDISPNGRKLCVLMNSVTNKEIGQNIVIKRFAVSKNLVVDFYRDTWNRQRGSNVKLMFDFVDNQP